MTTIRQAWGQSLIEQGRKHDNLIVVDADLATSTQAVLFEQEFPNRFIEVGIAEQNAIGIATGMSTLGFVPWVSSFGVFFTQRSLDQIRMLISQTEANVKIGGSYSGLLNGSSGKAHQDIEDIAILRGMPNMTVLSPADAAETRDAVAWATEHVGPVYVRLARNDEGDLPDDNQGFAIGQPRVLHQGKDAILISTGTQALRTLKAAEILSSQCIEVKVIHLPTIKPLDEEALMGQLGHPSQIVTVEDHSIYGGIGGMVSEIISSRMPGPRVSRIGLNDEWSQSGPDDFLLDRYGLSAQKVAEQVQEILRS